MKKNRSRIVIAVASLSFALCSSNGAAESQPPDPIPLPAPVAEAKDIPFPGVIRLHVDATDVARRIFRVQENIPVTGGESLTLLYPEWLPAKHSPKGRVDQIAGLIIKANGERLAWRRDVVNVYAIHVDVPAGSTSLDLEFQFVSPTTPDQGRVVMTAEMLNLQWTAVTFYPAGYYVRQIRVDPTVVIPEGWQLGTALRAASTKRGETRFEQVSFEDLIDSPIFAGRHFKRLDLDPGAEVSIHMNIVADSAEQLEITPEQLDIHRALVQEADALYASRHYKHYDFLVALSDWLGGIGLEHHQSSENSFAPSLFTDWDSNSHGRDLLAHEYTHSWNGKFRRPADLFTPDYAMPMRGSLLWVYEGQTQYWGNVLAARSGLHSNQESLEQLAMTAARFDHRRGRSWRTLSDTTNDPVATARRPQAWGSWSRNEDYYSEGQLIWLDADTLIRERSVGQKSLDDFAASFFGIDDGSIVPLTYQLEDVVSALNDVHEYDWETFLLDRLEGHGSGAPLDGIKRGGYELVYTDAPSDFQTTSQGMWEYLDLSFSIGLSLTPDGSVRSVQWDSPAFDAKFSIGDQIIAVNGLSYTGEGLERSITEAKDTDVNIELIVNNTDRYRSVSLDYHNGLRYPHLVRTGDGPSSLDAILESKR